MVFLVKSVIIDTIDLSNQIMTTVIPVNTARRHLGEVIQEARYGGKPFVLTRNKKPMVTLIGVKEFARMLKVIEKHDRGLADTLAIMSNPEIQEVLEQGEKDIVKGRTRPIEDLLED